jgi:hypothetical protein
MTHLGNFCTFSSLFQSITGVNDWAVANKMTLNQKNTKAMLITGKRLSAKMETKELDLQYEQVSSA